MPFTIAAWRETLAADGYTAVAAVADPHLRISGDHITVPMLTRLFWGHVRGGQLLRAQFRSPELRTIVYQQISPFQKAAPADGDYGRNALNLFDRPIQLERNEELDLYVDSGNVSGGITGLVIFGDEIVPVPDGPMRTIRCTSSTTLTGNQWFNCALTFPDPLPAGRYAIIGARFISAGIQAGRFVFPETLWRPGTLGFIVEEGPINDQFRFGMAGSWGEFEHDVPPTVDIFSTSADTSEVIYMDVVQVRAGAP